MASKSCHVLVFLLLPFFALHPSNCISDWLLSLFPRMSCSSMWSEIPFWLFKLKQLYFQNSFRFIEKVSRITPPYIYTLLVPLHTLYIINIFHQRYVCCLWVGSDALSSELHICIWSHSSIYTVERVLSIEMTSFQYHTGQLRWHEFPCVPQSPCFLCFFWIRGNHNNLLSLYSAFSKMFCIWTHSTKL